MVDKFNMLQRKFDKFTNDKKDWECLAVMIMFAFSVNFDIVQNLSPKVWLNYIFNYLDLKQIVHLESIKKGFSYNTRYSINKKIN